MRIVDNADRRAHTDPLFYDYKILKLFDHAKMENALFYTNTSIMNYRKALLIILK